MMETASSHSLARSRPATLLTNRARVLLTIATDATLRVRDIARIVGVTERTAQRIVSDLVANEYISRHRIGRRTTYEVHHEAGGFGDE